MAAILLERPTIPTVPATMPDEEPPDHQAHASMCPVCGSSMVYQTGEGRWGCTQCGATWS